MIHILPARQRAVVYTLGRLAGVKGPGLVFLMPLLQTMVRVDMGPATLELPNATVTYRVVDPAKALEGVADYRDAMKTLAETTLKHVLGDRFADALVFERKGIEEAVAKRMNDAIPPWGIHVDKVELKR